MLTSLPLDGGTETGFRRAVDVFIQQTHVVNRRVATALTWPLPDETAEQSESITESESGNTASDILPPHDGTNGDPAPHITNGDPPPQDITDGDPPPHDVTDGAIPAGTACHTAPLPAEAARLLCARLGVGSVAAVADSCSAVGVTGPSADRRLIVRKVLPRQAGAAAEWDLVIAGQSAMGDPSPPPIHYRGVLYIGGAAWMDVGRGMTNFVISTRSKTAIFEYFLSILFYRPMK